MLITRRRFAQAGLVAGGAIAFTGPRLPLLKTWSRSARRCL